MSLLEDSVVLTQTELAAILSLGGKSSLYGFASEQNIPTEEQMMDALCTLTRDGMVVLGENAVELRQDLYQVILPVLEAKCVLVLYNASGIVETLYYLGNGITAMELAMTGSCSLAYMDETELLEHLCGHGCIRCYDEKYPVRGKEFMTAFNLETPQEQLLEQANFLLTLVDVEHQTVVAWIRGIRQIMEPWMEAVDCGDRRTSVLTERNLDKELKLLLGGVQE